MSWWARARERYEALIVEFGMVAVTVYFTIFFCTLGGFWYAISAGLDVSGAAGQTGTFWGAYAATKLTQPLRIGLTLVATPVVASVKHRFWPAPPNPVAPSSSSNDVDR